MIEYLTPYAEVVIGDYRVQKVSDMQVVTGRSNPVDRARLQLPIEGLDAAAIRKGATVEIAQGYREKGLWPLFAGNIVDLAWGPRVTVLCKDRMNKLREPVVKSFVDATPKEVVLWCLQQAGVTNYVLSDSETTRRHYYVLRGQSIIESIALVNRTWGLDWDFYCEPDGTFVWGPWEESPRGRAGEVVVFEYGQNIIELIPFTEEQHGILTTIALPYLRHGHLIRIRDTRYWGSEVTARVERILHRYAEKKARVTIEWTVVN